MALSTESTRWQVDELTARSRRMASRKSDVQEAPAADFFHPVPWTGAERQIDRLSRHYGADRSQPNIIK